MTFTVEVANGKSYQTNLTTENADEAIRWFCISLDKMPEFNQRIRRDGILMAIRTTRRTGIYQDWADRLESLS